MTKANVRPNSVKNAALGRGHGQFDAIEAIKNELIIDPKAAPVHLAYKLATEAPKEFATGIVHGWFLREIKNALRFGVTKPKKKGKG